MLRESEQSGGPAFPEAPGDTNGYVGRCGMTLRDYFASKALQGLLADTRPLVVEDEDDVTQVYAQQAYLYADAMLEARK